MFDHIRGDELDQRKYPWINLTEAAVYLISPDDAERVRAINSHDWERPFKRLHKWIEDGKLTIYEGWTERYKAIPKEDFFGVRIRYPSYPEDRQEDIRRAYQAGFRTFIDCDLSQPRNRYFEARTFNPKWRDLKIRSQELVAIFEAENIEAFNEIAGAHPADQPKEQQTTKRGRKPEFSWDLIETECHRLMDYHSEFDASDPQWDCQARLEEALNKFCLDKWQREPGASTLREKLPEWLSAWRKRKTGEA